MIVAQGGFVALGVAAQAVLISAVRVKLSLGQGQTQVGVTFCIAVNVGAITAVIIRLSPLRGGVGVTRIGVASISRVALGVGVIVTKPRLGPQEVSKNRIGTISSEMWVGFLLFILFSRE
jgi:hypothetical protein